MNPQRLFAASLLSLLVSIATHMAMRWFPSDRFCLSQMFPYSPALDAVQYSWVNFADFYYPASVLRGPPTPEREKLWDDYVIREYARETSIDRILLNFRWRHRRVL